MFLYNKHRPTELKNNDFHPKIANQLVKLTEEDNLPNLLFYGLPGSGKKTLIYSTLFQIYGKDALLSKEREVRIKTKDSTTFTVTVSESNYHLEIDPSQKSRKDRQIIQYLIKDYATIRNFGSYYGKSRHKTIIIFNADTLSHDAQAALRVTMEKYSKTCTIILCACQLTKIISPIRSRCFLIRVPLPNIDQIKSVIGKTLKKEPFDFDNKSVDFAVKKSNYNLTKIFILLQCNNVYLEETWIVLLKKEIINNIFKICKSPRSIKINIFEDMRDAFYKILSHNITGKDIIKKMLELILEKIDNINMKVKIIKITADVEFLLSNASKELIHLEYYVNEIINLLALNIDI